MVAYRLYCLDRDGRISTADWIDATDDADAVAEAREMKRNGRKCEVWQKRRMVAMLEAHQLAE